MRKNVDYSSIRGFNYTLSIAEQGESAWLHYDHNMVERDMGYAERLRLNSVRIFLRYSCYVQDREAFLTNVKDFIRTAWKHGISTNPIIYFGFYASGDRAGEFEPVEGETLPPVAKTVRDPSLWHLGETYFDELHAAVGQEPGLLFWDISNEPGYTDNFLTWYEEEPAYVTDFRVRPNMEELREKQEITWEYIRHFCQYVKSVDPDHDIGIGNIFIWETEPSRTAEMVDVIVFHDYSATRSRLRGVLETARELGRKYNKPVVDNEMCCLCRGNPYDMAIQLHDEYQVGWYLFELMICGNNWNRVHGVVYPDGSVRDPSIAAAVMGFFRNRGEEMICSDVNQENYLDRAILYANRVILETRQNSGFDHSRDAEKILEVCEFCANLLEGGELVPMKYPPTAKIEAYRRMPRPNCEELRDYLMELLDTLKKSCHYAKESGGLKDLRL